MFGKRSTGNQPGSAHPIVKAVPIPAAGDTAADATTEAGATATPHVRAPMTVASIGDDRRQTRGRPQAYFDLKKEVFLALIEAIDVAQLSVMDVGQARTEVSGIIRDILAAKKAVISSDEESALVEDICDDVLGYGPLEPLLARDDISDIMVNGNKRIFIEVDGKVQETDIRFRDNTHLLNVCQRIVSKVGRRVDESSPICDARLPDGSRVNVIALPVSIDGPSLTIRRFKKDKLTLDQLVSFGAITQAGAEILKIIGRVRCNVLISGGTGSGKTTLLNCLTAYVAEGERIVTCEIRRNFSFNSGTSFDWRRARRTSRASVRSPCVLW